MKDRVLSLLSLRAILDSILKSSNKQEIKNNGNDLMSFVMSLTILFAGIASFIVGLLWHLETQAVVFQLVLFLLFSLFIMYIRLRVDNQRIKIHLVSIMVSICVVNSYFLFYDSMSVLFWFIVIIVAFIACLTVDKTLLFYVYAIMIALYLTTIYRNDAMIVVDATLKVALLIMLLMIVAITYLIHILYNNVIVRQAIQYSKIEKYNNLLKEQSHQLEKLAFFDTLTGLPNRKMLTEEMAFLIERCKKKGCKFIVAFIDIDDFKNINDTMGHDVGDIVLIEISNKIQEFIHQSDFVARLGGDELALIITRPLDEESLVAYLDSLCKYIYKPMEVNGKKLTLSISVGSSVYPDDGEKISDLLRSADTAMYKTKSMGKNSFNLFHVDMQEEIINKISIENELKKAIDREEFSLVYQPLLSSRKKTLVGYEVLIRWNSSKYGTISPLEFIPIAESLGIIIDIGNWVVKNACIDFAKFRGKENLYLSINVSPLEFMQEQYAKNMFELVTKNNVEPNQVMLEITETLLIKEPIEVNRIIRELRSYGFRVALDDFGTGYSSLNYLLSMEIDVLKIDKTFINAMSTNEKTQNIIASIIKMAHNLDLEVVAEGVEVKEQKDALEDMNCDLLQGYLIGYPSEKMINKNE